MTDDDKKHAIEVWAKIIDTQRRFCELLLQVRIRLLTLVAATIGAAVWTLEKGTTITIRSSQVNISSLLFVAGIVIVVAFYITEKGYLQLLTGAVKHGSDLEKQLELHFIGIGLTGRISQENDEGSFFWSITNMGRVRRLYLIICLLFLTAAIATSGNILRDMASNILGAKASFSAIPGGSLRDLSSAKGNDLTQARRP